LNWQRYQYVNDPAYEQRGIFGLVSRAEIYDGSSLLPEKRTDYEYDVLPSKPVVGVITRNVFATPGFRQDLRGALPANADSKRGQLQRIKRWQNPQILGNTQLVVTERQYTDAGALASIATAGQVLSVLQYSAAGGYALPDSVRSGDGTAQITTELEWELATGKPLSATRFGRRTQYGYDDARRLTSVTDPYRGSIQRTFGSDGLSHTDKISDSAGQHRIDLETAVNGFALPKRVVRRPAIGPLTGLGPPATQELFEYDGRGRLAQYAPPHVSVGASPMWRKFDYDALGRLVSTVMPDGSAASKSYVGLAPPQNVLPAGTIRKETDTHGRTLFIVTDALGRVTQVLEEPPVPGASWVSTQYHYDARSNLLSINSYLDSRGSNNPSRRFRYDGLSRLINRYLPERSATLDDQGQVSLSGSWSDAYQYDNQSRLTQHVDPRGVITTYDYQNDPLGRLFSIKTGLPAGANPAIVPVAETQFQYQTEGNPLLLERARVDGLYTETYKFDKSERLSEIRTMFDQAEGTITQKALRDRTGLLDRSDLEIEGNVVGQWRYLYDEIGRLTGVESYPNNRDWAVHASLNGAGQVQQLDFSSGSWVAKELFGLDQARNAIISHELYMGGTSVLLYNYYYGSTPDFPVIPGVSSGADQITATLDGVTGLIGEYQYDKVGRLASAITRSALPPRSDGTGSGNLYSYDPAGNRVASPGISYAPPVRTPIGSPPPKPPGPSLAPLGDSAADGQSPLTFDLRTNHLAATGYVYDAAGNVTRLPRKDGSALLLDYDALGRLARVRREGTPRSETYVYNHANQLIVVDRDDGSRSYFVWRNASESTTLTPERGRKIGRTTTMETSITLGNRIVARLSIPGADTAGTNAEFVHQFHNGMFTTSSRGVSAHGAAHLPYGYEGTAPKSSFVPRYHSYARSRFGLDYAINRHYDPETGRFIQPDPLGERVYGLEDPQSLNLYSFARSDPLNRRDPLGLDDPCNPGETTQVLPNGWISCLGPGGKAYRIYQSTVHGTRDLETVWGEWVASYPWLPNPQAGEDALPFPFPWKSRGAKEDFERDQENAR
jgi:RHS repeat-associated protein